MQFEDIRDRVNSAFRDSVVQGVPASGDWEPLKLEIRTALNLIIIAVGDGGFSPPPDWAADLAEINGQLEAIDGAVSATGADRTAVAADRSAVATDRTATEDARDDALAYASLTGPFQYYATKAAANTALAGLPANQLVQVWVDESQGGARTVYKKVGSAYLLQATLDYITPSSTDTLTNKTLAGAQNIHTDGDRLGLTDDTVSLSSPGALLHAANIGGVTCTIRASSHWTGSTGAPYQNNDTSLWETFNKIESDSTNYSWSGSFPNAYNDIPAGVTDSGIRTAVFGWATSVSGGDYIHAGTLEFQIGAWGTAGFQGAGSPSTAIVNNAIGVRGVIINESAGATVVNATAGEFTSAATVGVVQNNTAVFASAQHGTISNHSFFGEAGTMVNTDQALFGVNYPATQSEANVASRDAGNSFEFGHPDPTGYGSNLGATTSSGYPFLAFCAEADPTGDTFRTRGKKGSAILGGLDGSLIFVRFPTATAAAQGLSNESARFDPDGHLSLAQTPILPTKTPASATAAGEAGEVCWDANYVYVCVATNAWRRAAIAAW